MTVKELIELLYEMPEDAEVYAITDTSDNNRNEDGGYIVAHRIGIVESEDITGDGWDEEIETNILLMPKEE